LVLKRPERKANHLLPCNFKGKGEWSCTSAASYACIVSSKKTLDLCVTRIDLLID